MTIISGLINSGVENTENANFQAMIQKEALRSTDIHYPGLLYAIVAFPDEPERFEDCLSSMQGIDHSKLFTVCYYGLVAVLAETGAKKVVANTKNALAYAAVIDKLFSYSTVLPIRFGTLVDSESSVITLLQKYERNFDQNLRQVKNREEFSLKVILRNEKKKDLFSGENVPASFDGNSESKQYLLQKIKNYHLENALLSYADQLIADIRKLMDQFNVLYHFKKMRTDTMILDAVFLLEKGRKDAFIETINRLKSQYHDLSFLLTGPWPPYNFVELNIK